MATTTRVSPGDAGKRGGTSEKGAQDVIFWVDALE
jgi:hypothetical protein